MLKDQVGCIEKKNELGKKHREDKKEKNASNCPNFIYGLIELKFGEV